MKTLHLLPLALASMVLATSAGAATAACDTGANLVANCGFESGDFTGWTLSGDDVADTLGVQYGVEGTDPFPLPDGTAPASGDWQAFVDTQAARATTLSQTFATTAGTHYTVSFSLAQYLVGPGDVNNTFTASFGATTFASLSDVGEQGYALYSFDVTAAGVSTTLSLTAGDDVGEFLLDDVSVTAANVVAVPEPSSLASMALGLLGLAGVARRRRGLTGARTPRA